MMTAITPYGCLIVFLTGFLFGLGFAIAQWLISHILK